MKLVQVIPTVQYVSIIKLLKLNLETCTQNGDY